MATRNELKKLGASFAKIERRLPRLAWPENLVHYYRRSLKRLNLIVRVEKNEGGRLKIARLKIMRILITVRPAEI